MKNVLKVSTVFWRSGWISNRVGCIASQLSTVLGTVKKLELVAVGSPLYAEPPSCRATGLSTFLEFPLVTAAGQVWGYSQATCLKVNQIPAGKNSIDQHQTGHQQDQFGAGLCCCFQQGSTTHWSIESWFFWKKSIPKHTLCSGRFKTSAHTLKVYVGKFKTFICALLEIYYLQKCILIKNLYQDSDRFLSNKVCHSKLQQYFPQRLIRII